LPDAGCYLLPFTLDARSGGGQANGGPLEELRRAAESDDGPVRLVTRSPVRRFPVLRAIAEGSETLRATTIAVALTVALVAGCGGTDTADMDSAVLVSCEQFRRVMADFGSGILTDAELREQLKEIDRSASVSEHEDIRTGARSMLAAVTGGDVDGFLASAQEFDAACDRLGQ
jgi:hypothetical protein